MMSIAPYLAPSIQGHWANLEPGRGRRFGMSSAQCSPRSWSAAKQHAHATYCFTSIDTAIRKRLTSRSPTAPFRLKTAAPEACSVRSSRQLTKSLASGAYAHSAISPQRARVQKASRRSSSQPHRFSPPMLRMSPFSFDKQATHERAYELAGKHQLGFFEASSPDGEIWLPGVGDGLVLASKHSYRTQHRLRMNELQPSSGHISPVATSSTTRLTPKIREGASLLSTAAGI